MFCGEVLCSIHNSSRRPLCALIPVIRVVAVIARKLSLVQARLHCSYAPQLSHFGIRTLCLI